MAWLVPLLPLLAAPALAFLGRAGRRGWAAALGAGALAATAGVAAAAAAGGWRGSLVWSGLVTLRLDLADPASGLVAVLVPAVAAPVLAFAAFHEEARGLGRLLAVLAVFAGSMELLVAAADLLTLLVAWELVGACSWLLIAHRWRERGVPRSANVAFLVTRAGDLGLFLAAAVAFAGTGSFDYTALPTLSRAHLELLVAGLLVAAAAKSAQAPFAPWLFAAMAGPVSVSALLHAATMVAAGAFLLVRLHPVLDLAAWFGPAAVALGLATALAGGLVALLQPHAKRLLAGSTSAHHGLMFVAAGAGYPAVAALHLVAHALFKAPLFLVAGIAAECAGSHRLAGLRVGRALPGVAAASAVAALALAGVPPLGGAWTKEGVVTAAGHLGTSAPWAAVLAILAGGLAAAYAARFQLQAFGRGGPHACEGRAAHRVEVVALGLLAAATAGLALLWLPGARELAARLLGGEVPAPKAWELGLSLATVAAGLALGRAVARRRPRLGESGLAARAGDWLGLPALGRAAVARPAFALARTLAAFDDRVLDTPPRLVATIDRRFAPLLARGDDRVVDAGVRSAAVLGRRLAAGLARRDDVVVDAGVRGTAAFGAWLAARSSRLGEAALDGVPEGVSRATGAAGRAARRLQTGLTHHYYRLVVAGLVVWLGLAAALLVLRP